MKVSLIAGSVTLMCSAALPTFAATLDISIQNLTRGIAFTPLYIAAHNDDVALFSTGQPASAELQMMAEGGDIAALQTSGDAAGADSIANPADGLLMPAASTSAMLETTDGNNYLSVVAMMLPTNDGFIGLNSWKIPTEPGTYTININAYDAGTEANDEVRGSGEPGEPGEPGMPVPPPLEELVGTNGTGVAATITNPNVHIHLGNLGDDDIAGGTSDVQNTVSRWLNPVARVTVTVTQ